MAVIDPDRKRRRRDRWARMLGIDRLEPRRLLTGDLGLANADTPTATMPAGDGAETRADLTAELSLAFGGLELPDFQANSALSLDNQSQTYSSLANTIVTMTGKSELWITGATSPVTGSTFHLDSEDAWLFFPGIKPSVVNSSFLSQVRVSGSIATHGSNVRVVQHGTGTVVIPHTPAFKPLEVFTGPNFTGSSATLGQYTYFNSAATLGVMQGSISSFKLERGYMATFATEPNGGGASKVYVAQDFDLDISFLPGELDNAIHFVRVLPWRWVAKKGTSDLGADSLDASWRYNWNNNLDSTLDWEYVPIRQQRYWPGLPTTKQNVTTVLGFNEPDNPVEDAYQTLGNGSIEAALAYWPQMLSTGHRVGSPAVTDGGRAWLYEFMDKAIARNLRVDFIAIHNYQANHTAASLSNWLKQIHDRYQLPIWVTEFNNGANWTTAPDPTLQQNADWVASITDMFDTTPWIERYSIYSNVEDVRKMVNSSNTLTPAGVVYRNNASPIGYVQELPPAASASGRRVTQLPFDGNTLDTSGYGNNGQLVGPPQFVAGRRGQALRFDGSSTAVKLPDNVVGGSAFTFAGWVNWEGGGNWQRIFDFGSSTNSYMFLTPSNGSSLRFGIRNGGSEQRVETAALPVGQWTHVAVTLGGGVARLYVNGSPAAANPSITITPDRMSLVRNYLGDSQFSADPLFKGSLDDVLITDTALSPSQIAALATNRPPVFQTRTITTAAIARGATVAGNLAGQVTDPDPGDSFTFAKAHGPSWLTVSPSGGYFGTLPTSQTGLQEFVVTATDSRGGVAYANLLISIDEVFWRGDVSGVWTATSNGNTNWSTDAGGAVDPGRLPDGSTDVVFAATGATNLPSVTLGADVAVRGIRVTSEAGMSLRGANSLTLGASGLQLVTGSGSSSILTTGQVILGDSQTWELASDLTVTSPITGPASLTKSGRGTLQLLGSSGYAGGTTITEGTFRIGNGGVTGSILGNVANHGQLVIDRSTELTLAGRISGTGSLTKWSAGRLVLSSTNSYSGGTTIGSDAGAGVVRATAAGALGSGPVAIGPGGNATTARLELANNVALTNLINLPMRNNSSVAVQNIGGSNVLAGTITLNVGGSTAVFQSDAGLLTLGAITSTAGGDRAFTLQGVGDGRLAGLVTNGSGIVSLVKNGVGTWTLGAANTYTGTTRVNAGTLALDGSHRIADASNLILGGGTLATGGFSDTVATISLTDNSTIDLGTGASTLRANAIGNFTANRSLAIVNWTPAADRFFIGQSAGLTPVQLAQITINGNAVEQTATGEIVPLAVANPDTTLSVAAGESLIAPVLSGPGRLIKQGAGSLVLEAANSHSGGMIVEEGTVVIRSVSALGSGPLEVRAGATVRLDAGLTSVALSQLDLAPGATLDLGEGGIEIGAGGTDEIRLRAWVLAGHSGGSWLGSSGIRSTAAAVSGGSRTLGYRVNPDGSAKVIFTALGDLDLDRDVDAFDLIAMNSSGRYGSSQAAGWPQGDVNYDGRATVFDLVGINSGGAFGAGPIRVSVQGTPATSSPAAAGTISGGAIDPVRLTVFSKFAAREIFDALDDD